MTPELLRQVGEALYGLEWRMPLARDLGVNYQTIRRHWQSGDQTIPPGVVADLQRLLIAARAEAASRVLEIAAAEAALKEVGHG